MEHHRAYENTAWHFKAKLPHCQIWQNRSSMLIAEAYLVENYERTHARINRNKPHLVNALGTVYDERRHQNYILVERIPNRLSEVNTLTESQSLKVMYAVFKGLQELAEIYGIVGITQSCICFNQNGKVKIWANSDLSSVYPILSQRQNGINNLKRIVSNIYQIISMIEKKCFNMTFLRPFLKKLSENRIVSYCQAAQQILKIGDLLFVVVEEKQNINSKSPGKNDDYHGKNIQYNQMRADLKTLKIKREGSSGHTRQFSDHNEIKQHKHRRYESNFGEQNTKRQTNFQMPTNFALNFQKFSQSQTYDNANPHFHKSAPLTPRDDQARQQKNSISSRTNAPQQLKSSISPPSTSPNTGKKSLAFQKKQQKTVTICCPYTTLENSNFDHVLQQTSQFNDSFCTRLKPEDKQLHLSGQFQTFGMLQDSPQLNRKYGKPKEKYQNNEQNFSKNKSRDEDYEEVSLDKKQRRGESPKQFDVKAFEMQMQKRLARKQQKTKITSINGQGFNNEAIPSIKNFSKTDPQVFKANTTRDKLKTISYEGQNSKQSQQFTYIPPKGSYIIRNDTQQGTSFIDRKYQQYMQSKQFKRQGQQTLREQPRTLYTSPSRYIKQFNHHDNIRYSQQSSPTKHNNYQHKIPQSSNKSAGNSNTNPNLKKTSLNSIVQNQKYSNVFQDENLNTHRYQIGYPNSSIHANSNMNNGYRNLVGLKGNDGYEAQSKYQYKCRVETQR